MNLLPKVENERAIRMGNERRIAVDKEFVFIQNRKKRARSFYRNVIPSSKALFAIEKYSTIMSVDLFSD